MSTSIFCISKLSNHWMSKKLKEFDWINDLAESAKNADSALLFTINYLCIFAQLSTNPMVRLKTSWSGAESSLSMVK